MTARDPATVLLPGMDGTARLFEPIRPYLPDPRPIAYPDEPLGYAALEVLVREQLPRRPFVLVGESFSGPVAVRIAADPPETLVSLVLVATFVVSPVPIPPVRATWIESFLRPPPVFAIRRFMVGPEAPETLVEAVQDATSRVSPATMAHRAASVLSVDVREALAAVRVPMLYIQATEDRMVRPRSLAAIQEIVEIPVERIEGPHLICQARPEACAAVIRSAGGG